MYERKETLYCTHTISFARRLMLRALRVIRDNYTKDSWFTNEGGSLCDGTESEYRHTFACNNPNNMF